MTNKKFVINDGDWAHELETGVADYTDMLFEAVYEGPDDEIPETLSGNPFCGCADCFWREALFYLVPRLLEGYNEGKVELIEE
jgi:hypothetical protein